MIREERPEGVGKTVVAAFVYGRLMARARLERRSERVRDLLEGWLPVAVANRLLAATIVCALGWYAVEAILSYTALFGLLRLVGPAASLGLMFAFLLLGAGHAGLSAVGRAMLPADRERLLLTPLSDGGSYLLSFVGNNVLNLSERLLLLPVICGISATAALRGEVSLPALWVALALVIVQGCALSLIVARTAGVVWVRRMRRGAGAGSAAAYGLFSAASFGTGTLVSGALGLVWTPGADGRPSPDSAPYARAPGATIPFERLAAHPASPVGGPVRAAVEGGLPDLLPGAVWAAALAVVATAVCRTGGGWHREGWPGGRPEGGMDLYGLAEKAYLGLARILFRGDPILAVQLRNLCRQRQRDASGPFSLFGGPLVWGWAGFSWGVAPFLSGREDAATIFVLVMGGWISMEHLRIAFEKHRGSLALEAEGPRAAFYRVSGRGMFELYRAKLRGSRLVGGVPLFASLALVALLAELPLGLCALLFTVGAAWLVAWTCVELLPGLASPQFGWDHPEDLGGGLDQEVLYGAMEGIVAGALWAVCLALVLLQLGGWTPPDVHAWVASGIFVVMIVAMRAILDVLGRRAARVADHADLPE